MRIGIQFIWFNWGEGASADASTFAPTLKRIAQAADAAGVASLWTIDHFFQMEFAGDARDPMLETYTTLGFLAGVTERIELGTLVTSVVYRHPGALIKTVSTLDVLSGGRAWLGIGAAWYEREARGLGLPFPPLKERFERLEEALQIAHRMWNRADATVDPYQGVHYQLAEPIDSPHPLSQPHPRILIGGEGEKKTLRMVAQYGDACNFDGGLGVDGIQHKLNVLREHCNAHDRDYDAIERTVVHGAHRVPDGDTADGLIRYCESLAKIGVQHVIFNTPQMHDLKLIDLLGEKVIPAVRGL
ncbi:MAG: LLM class F420-dependent oxidoreductase [Chloroflexota bacterium]|nr:LLM class F420-dependent oxidoreductase [Chloroflexota bacterium]